MRGIAILITTVFACVPSGYTEDSIFQSKTGSANSKNAIFAESRSKWTSIQTLLVEYRAIEANVNEFELGVQKTMALIVPDRFYHSLGHITTITSAEVDPFRQVSIVNGSSQYHVWPARRSYSEATLQDGRHLGASIPNDILLAIIPFWPNTNYSFAGDSKTGKPLVLAQILEDDDCVLVDGYEYVDGEKCIKLNYNGRDVIWLVVDKGLYLKKRITYGPGGKKISEIVTTDVGRLESGQWFPRACRIKYFNNDAQNSAGKETNLTITRFVVDGLVSENLFEAPKMAGTLKTSPSDNTVIQVVSGGEELLDEVVSFVGSVSEKQDPVLGRALGYLLVFSISAMIGCRLVTFLGRGTRMRKVNTAIL